MAKGWGRAAPAALALAFMVAFALAVGGSAGQARAAADGSGGVVERPAVGLRDAVLEALAHSPSIRAARARLAEAEAAAAAAEAEAGGRIDGEVNGGYSWLSAASLRNMMGGGMQDGGGAGGGTGGGGGTTLPLPTSGTHATRGTGAVTWTGSLWNSPQKAAALLGAQATRAAALKAWQDAVNDVIRNVAEAYLGLLQAQEGERVAAVRLQWAEEALRVARAREQSGTATPVEVLEAEAELLDARASRDDARRLRDLAANQLLLWMGRPLDGAISAIDPLDHQDPLTREIFEELQALVAMEGGRIDLDTERAVGQALERRLDVTALQAQMHAAAAGVAATETGSRARIGVSGAYQWRDAELTMELNRWGQGRVRAEGGRQWLSKNQMPMRQEPEWRVGLQVAWTLSDGGAQKRREEEARARVAAAEAALEQLVPGIELEVEAAFRDLYRAYAAQEAAAARRDAAAETVRRIEQLYARDAATEAERLGARTRLEAATMEWRAARWNVVAAQIRMAIAVGWSPSLGGDASPLDRDDPRGDG